MEEVEAQAFRNDVLTSQGFSEGTQRQKSENGNAHESKQRSRQLCLSRVLGNPQWMGSAVSPAGWAESQKWAEQGSHCCER